MSTRYELRIVNNRPSTGDDPHMHCSNRQDATRKVRAFLKQAGDQIRAIYLDTCDGENRIASERLWPGPAV